MLRTNLVIGVIVGIGLLLTMRANSLPSPATSPVKPVAEVVAPQPVAVPPSVPAAPGMATEEPDVATEELDVDLATYQTLKDLLGAWKAEQAARE